MGYFQPYVHVLHLLLSTNTDNKSNVSQSEYVNTKHFYSPHKNNFRAQVVANISPLKRI